MYQATSSERLLCAGPEKAAEQLLFPSPFAPLLGQSKSGKRLSVLIGKEGSK